MSIEVRVTIAIDVDVDEWARTYNVKPGDVIPDIRRQVLEETRDAMIIMPGILAVREDADDEEPWAPETPHKCSGCGRPMRPGFGKFCSTGCAMWATL